MKTFEEIVNEVCGNISTTLKKKNHDYGDSFFKQIAKHGDIAALLRIEEKVDRLDSLLGKDALVAESIDDTLLDLAGYAILTLVSHQRMKGE